MAGDWIRMRTDIYRDPKVCVIADALTGGDLVRYVSQAARRDSNDSNVTGNGVNVTRNGVNVTRNAVVGALVTVWGVMRHRGKRRGGDDLVVANCTLAILDDIASLPGFGEAMATSGWVLADGKALVFPRFFKEFNTEPAADTPGSRAETARAKNAERQRQFRQRKATEKATETNVTSNVTRNVIITPRIEKSREEYIGDESPNPSCPATFPTSPGPTPAAEAVEIVLTFPVVGKGSKVWPLTRPKVCEFEEAFPGLDVLAECRKALQWVRENQPKTARGMGKFLFRWLGRAQNARPGAERPGAGRAAPGDLFGAGMEKRLREKGVIP